MKQYRITCILQYNFELKDPGELVTLAVEEATDCQVIVESCKQIEDGEDKYKEYLDFQTKL